MNKKLDISVYISPKYWILAGIDMILPNNFRLAKKLVKLPIIRRNIGNFRYFGKISKVYLTHACTEISGKISIKY